MQIHVFKAQGFSLRDLRQDLAVRDGVGRFFISAEVIKVRRTIRFVPQFS
jgi:hypothetical protein